jgi:diacylglycerol O-acyltransferase
MNANEPATVERLSPQDLMQLACDVGPAPMQVAGILILDAADELALSTVVKAITGRINAVPRLRQRLARTALGYGSPIWVDDPRFDIHQHVHCVHCPAPGDEQALLTVATAAATRRLPADRPLWSMTLVTGLAHGRAGLVVVMHHVVADGLAGLAVLTSLVDGAAPVPHRRPPRPPPSRRLLLANAAQVWLRAIAAFPGTLRRLHAAAAELRPIGTAPAPACSLNQPTGERRMLAIARVDLAAARTVAHVHGATVNDVLLAAVSGALRSLLRDRGERLTPVCLQRSTVAATHAPTSAKPAAQKRSGRSVWTPGTWLPPACGPLHAAPRLPRSNHHQPDTSSPRPTEPIDADHATTPTNINFSSSVSANGRRWSAGCTSLSSPWTASAS